MHEFALYGQTPKHEQPRLLQQLAGVTRMQPQQVREIHLVFKALPPAGLNNIPSGGGSQGVLSQDVQRVKSMLNAGLYYIQLVGEVDRSSRSSPAAAEDSEQSVDTEMVDGSASNKERKNNVKWHLEFKDTPDAGKQSVSTRLVSKTPIEGGDMVQFFTTFGYEYVSRYMVVGDKFYDENTTIFLYKVLKIPQIAPASAAKDTSFLSDVDALPELDATGGYTLRASIDVTDGNNPELKDKATRQLLSLKETMRQAITLTPGDRLALDSRLPPASRQT